MKKFIKTVVVVWWLAVVLFTYVATASLCVTIVDLINDDHVSDYGLEGFPILASLGVLGIAWRVLRPNSG